VLTVIKDIDLINEIENYDVILVGTNTYQTMGNGFQRKIRTRYPIAQELNLTTKYGDKAKLGTRITTNNNTSPIFSLCFITYGFNFRPDKAKDYLDYDALETCIKTANNEFIGLKVATTLIGSSKFDGNGDKERIMEILKNNSNKIDLYIYDYEQLSRDQEQLDKYHKTMKTDKYTKEEKIEIFTKFKEEDAKLSSDLESPQKRKKRLKDEIRKLLEE